MPKNLPIPVHIPEWYRSYLAKAFVQFIEETLDEVGLFAFAKPMSTRWLSWETGRNAAIYWGTATAFTHGAGRLPYCNWMMSSGKVYFFSPTVWKLFIGKIAISSASRHFSAALVDWLAPGGHARYGGERVPGFWAAANSLNPFSEQDERTRVIGILSDILTVGTLYKVFKHDVDYAAKVLADTTRAVRWIFGSTTAVPTAEHASLIRRAWEASRSAVLTGLYNASVDVLRPVQHTATPVRWANASRRVVTTTQAAWAASGREARLPWGRVHTATPVPRATLIATATPVPIAQLVPQAPVSSAPVWQRIPLSVVQAPSAAEIELANMSRRAATNQAFALRNAPRIAELQRIVMSEEAAASAAYFRANPLPSAGAGVPMPTASSAAAAGESFLVPAMQAGQVRQTPITSGQVVLGNLSPEAASALSPTRILTRAARGVGIAIGGVFRVAEASQAPLLAADIISRIGSDLNLATRLAPDPTNTEAQNQLRAQAALARSEAPGISAWNGVGYIFRDLVFDSRRPIGRISINREGTGGPPPGMTPAEAQARDRLQGQQMALAGNPLLPELLRASLGIAGAANVLAGTVSQFSGIYDLITSQSGGGPQEGVGLGRVLADLRREAQQDVDALNGVSRSRAAIFGGQPPLPMRQPPPSATIAVMGSGGAGGVRTDWWFRGRDRNMMRTLLLLLRSIKDRDAKNAARDSTATPVIPADNSAALNAVDVLIFWLTFELTWRRK